MGYYLQKGTISISTRNEEMWEDERILMLNQRLREIEREFSDINLMVGGDFEISRTECPYGGVCVMDKLDGHPCDRDENGSRMAACAKT